jgi:acetyl-CoA synthetase
MSVWQQARQALDGLPGGGGLNIAHEAVDRHVAHGCGERVALRFISSGGTVSEMSYRQLARESNRFANVLRSHGVKAGDSVFTLLGRIPALYVASLGTLKIGAVFSSLFSAFGPDPIKVRLARGNARVLVTTETLFGRKVEALLADLPNLKTVIVVGNAPRGTTGYARAMAAAAETFTIPPTDPEAPALLHFTSGTTGAPKGALHVHEAVVAHDATARIALDLGPGTRFWCTADPGWVTGVSYGIIAPLVRGATAVVDEGEFEPERWYRILEEHRIAVWYTAPTAIRMLVRAGADLARRHDLSALRVAASVGEPLNAEAVLWGRDTLGRAFRDTWWQTETGAIMIANVPDGGATAGDVRPGAMGRPLPGIEAAVVRRIAEDKIAEIGEAGAEGELALKAGWPSMFRDYLGAHDRYRACFAGGYYLTGDLVRRDADGWFWFVGRADDVIKSAGHLIGPFEVESVLLSHPSVAEAGVIGTPDAVVGEVVKAFVALKDGVPADDALRRELLALARRRLGPAVAPRDILFRPSLPKTRSGKIMRRLLKARELGLPEGDLSMLEPDPGAGTRSTLPSGPGETP